jgi:hypothetical protein
MTVAGQAPASTTEQGKPAAEAVAIKLDRWQKVVALRLSNGLGIRIRCVPGLQELQRGRHRSGVRRRPDHVDRRVRWSALNKPQGGRCRGRDPARPEAGAAAVENVERASKPQAVGQQVKQQHPELAPKVERVKDAVHEATQEGASVVASVPTAPDPQVAGQEVQQQHPELACEAAAVAVVAITDPGTLRKAADTGVLQEKLANVDPANIEPTRDLGGSEAGCRP